MKKLFILILFVLFYQQVYCWGFYAHRQINYHAVFLLPPQMMAFYKKHIEFLREHAVAPDMRRYAIAIEGPRHFIDLDHYGNFPYDSLPRNWNDAVDKYSEDSLLKHGIVPWWVNVMLRRLTQAFKENNTNNILKLSAELGHYMSDAHVPLHATSNYNGQKTNQHGIHGFWESRAPELLAEKEWDFFIGKATYINKPLDFIWERVLESAAAADSVLMFEKILSEDFPPDQKFSFENRNGRTIRQYSAAFTRAYDKLLNGMIERRMRQSIYAIACFWYTAWVDAGQPDLSKLSHLKLSEEEINEMETLRILWQKNTIKGREHE